MNQEIIKLALADRYMKDSEIMAWTILYFMVGVGVGITLAITFNL